MPHRPMDLLLAKSGHRVFAGSQLAIALERSSTATASRLAAGTKAAVTADASGCCFTADPATEAQASDSRSSPQAVTTATPNDVAPNCAKEPRSARPALLAGSGGVGSAANALTTAPPREELSMSAAASLSRWNDLGRLAGQSRRRRRGARSRSVAVVSEGVNGRRAASCSSIEQQSV